MSGTLDSSAKSDSTRSSESVPFTCASLSPSTVSAAICAVNVLVAATPISGPACVYSTPSDSRVTREPTTLVIAMTFAPRSRASRTPASVSAVSPDCVMATTSVSSSTIGSA